MKSNQTPHIIITGASGFLGSHLVKHFAAKQWHVTALVRHAERYQNTPHVTYREYDLAKPFKKEIFTGADYLVHAAYLKHSRRNPQAYEINIKATKRLLAASRTYKLKKNLFMSTMSAHDEAISVYGRQKLFIEKLFNSGRDVVLRSGLIIGNGGIVKEMVSFMRSRHVVPLVDGGKQPLQIIGLYDLIAVIERALVGKASGRFTVATPQVYSYKRFYQILARAIDTKIIFISIPFIVLLSMMRLVALLRLPLNIGEDNLWGLKQLRSAKTAVDLKKLQVTLDDLETVLQRPGILPQTSEK